MSIAKAPNLSAVLKDEVPRPFDLQSFAEFCKSEYVAENLDFLLITEKMQNITAPSVFATELKKVRDNFIHSEGSSSINIEHEMRVQTLKDIDALLEKLGGSNDGMLNASQTGLSILKPAQKAIFELLSSATYTRYVVKLTVTMQVELSVKQALWWKDWRELTLKEFFSFPSPVDSADSRIHALLGMICIIVIILIAQFIDRRIGGYIGIYMCFGYFMRFLSGPRLDPQAFVVLFLLRPLFTRFHILEHNFYSGFPRRMAQLVAFLFAFPATVLLLFFPEYYIPAYVLLVCLFGANLLAGPFDFCLVCFSIKMLVKHGYIEPELCTDCAVEFVAIPKPGSDPENGSRLTMIAVRKVPK